MRGRRRTSSLIGLLTILVLLAACARIPGSGSPENVSKVVQQANVSGVGGPTQGEAPDLVVRGFIDANVGNALDTGSGLATAKAYLTAENQKSWQVATTPVVILADAYRTDVSEINPQSVTVTVGGSTQGMLDAQRAYHDAGGASYSKVFHLVEVAGQWRITDPPADLTITNSDFTSQFSARTVYFLDAGQTVVVPDLRYIPNGSSPESKAGRLISLLINGPSGVLAGAVKSELTGADLRTNITTDPSNVTHVDLTGVPTLTPAQKRALAAQVVWTLDSDAYQVAITIGGEPLDRSQLVYTKAVFSSFDPDRTPGNGVVAPGSYYVTPTNEIHSLVDGSPMWGTVGDGGYAIQSAAMSAATGEVAAVVDDGSGSEELLTGRPLEKIEMTPVIQGIKGVSLTQPSFTRAGDQVWVVQTVANNTDIYQIAASAQDSDSASRRKVEVGQQLTGKGTVTALALSPDNVRVAIVAGQKLYMGSIATADPVDATGTTTTGTDATGSVSIINLQQVNVGLGEVGAIAFQSSIDLMVAALSPNALPFRTVSRVSIDGRERTAVTYANISGDVDSIAVSDDSMYITYNNRVWELEGGLTDGKWLTPTGPIAGVVAGVLAGSNPFYPD